jgi:hypothetical protein
LEASTCAKARAQTAATATAAAAAAAAAMVHLVGHDQRIGTPF